MKNKFIITLLITALSATVLLNPIIGYADGTEISMEGETSVSVGAINGSNTFKVSIPTHDYDHDFYMNAYNKIGYVCAEAKYQGDLPSDEYIKIQIDKNTSYNESTGKKASVDTVSNLTIDSDLSIKSGYDLQNNQTYIKNVMVRTKQLTAGDWKCPVHYTISIENVPICLTKENILNMINDDTTINELTIPGTIGINGKTYNVGGIAKDALSDFSNLTVLNLEKSNTDWYKLSDEWYNGIGESSDLTINCNGNNMYLKQVPRSTQFHYLNTGDCIISGNPFGGENDSTYAEVTDFDWSKVVAFKSGCPISVTEYIISPEMMEYKNGMINAAKINVPYLETCCETLKFSGNAEEIYYNNDVIPASCFLNMTNLKKVTLGPNVRTIGEDAFSGCTSLTEIVIPETVTNIATSAFTATPYINNLKSDAEDVFINGIFICKGSSTDTGNTYTVASDAAVVQSSDIGNKTIIDFAPNRTSTAESPEFSGLFSNIAEINFSNVQEFKALDVSQFPKLTKITLGNSNKRVKDSAFNNMSTLKTIELNEGLEYIGNSAFNHCTGYTGASLTIPASVKAIGSINGNKMCSNPFYDFGNNCGFNDFLVADGSEHFAAIDGVLYTKDLTTLVAVPIHNLYGVGNTLTLPDETINLSEKAFSKNQIINVLVLGDNTEIHSNQSELNNGAYTTKMTGNSLSCAVGDYTNVREYKVKDTNPNYTSIDGVIYSKDMKKLIAVPPRCLATKVQLSGGIIHYTLDIPEGVEEWCENALWLDSTDSDTNAKFHFINIPTTMKKIDPRQLEYILNKGYTITWKQNYSMTYTRRYEATSNYKYNTFTYNQITTDNKICFIRYPEEDVSGTNADGDYINKAYHIYVLSGDTLQTTSIRLGNYTGIQERKNGNKEEISGTSSFTTSTIYASEITTDIPIFEDTDEGRAAALAYLKDFSSLSK